MNLERQWKRTAAVLAAVTMTLATLGFREHLPQQLSASAKTISEIEAEKKAKQDEIDRKKAEAEALAGDISRQTEYQNALQEEIELINSRMMLIDTQIQSINAEIEEKQLLIAELENQIADQQAETDQGLVDFKMRIRTLYVHGNDSLLSALVGATDFYDVLAKIDLIKRISKHDDEMMTNLQQELRALSDNKAELNTQVQTLSLRQTEMQGVRGEFSASRGELDAAMEKAMLSMSELELQQANAQHGIADAEDDLEALEEEEEAMILEAARKAAEEAQKKADEEVARKKAAEEAAKKAAEEAARKQSEEASRRAATTTTTTTTTTTRATTTTTAKTTVTTVPGKNPVTTSPTTAVTTTAKVTTSTSKGVTTVTTTTTKAVTTTTTTAPPKPSGVLAWPAPGFYHISSGFGPRWGRQHKGIDIAGGGQNISGANACAAKGGTVIKAKLGYNGGYGNYVQIDHGNGLNTLYAHLQSVSVSVGQTVSTGTVVGKIGSTGNSTGPHLHFSVIVNGTFVDPMGYLY